MLENNEQKDKDSGLLPNDGGGGVSYEDSQDTDVSVVNTSDAPQINGSQDAAMKKRKMIIIIFSVIASLVSIYFTFFSNNDSGSGEKDDVNAIPNAPRNNNIKNKKNIPGGNNGSGSGGDGNDVGAIAASGNNANAGLQQGGVQQLSAPELKNIAIEAPKPPPPPIAPPPPELPPPPVTTFSPPSDGNVSAPILQNESTVSLDLQTDKVIMQENSIIFGGASSGGGNAVDSSDSTKTVDDKNAVAAVGQQSSFLGFSDGAIGDGSIPASSGGIQATIVRNLDRTILQGKIINAVLETAINTQIVGGLRAIISRDVYGEHGSNVIIPQGSRLLGTYSTGVSSGQTRIQAIWDRLILPSGIDIKLSSPAVDNLGRVGIVGDVHDNWLEKIASALLISYVIPIAANKISGLGDQPVTTTTTQQSQGNPATTTTNTTVESQTLMNSTQQFQSMANSATKEKLNVPTIISVPQGTEINVFVIKDLIFPPQAMIQTVPPGSVMINNE